ncbi:MAG: hypothetical protein AAGI38_07005 [Bacteroidota bacterium]
MKTARINIVLSSVLLSLFLGGCASDDAIPITNEENFSFGTPSAEKDYLLFTRSGSSANGFITGFDSFPEGNIDVPALPTTKAYPAISGGISFRNYVVNQQKLFGGPGYQRIFLDEAFVPVERDIIETFGGGSAVAMLNNNKGYYVDFNSQNIQVFDPERFVRLGEIDLSTAFTIPANDANHYNTLYLRDNRLFACLYTGRNFPPFAYESDVGSVVAVINTDTDTLVKNIFRADTKFPGMPFLRFNSSFLDEADNLYLVTQGGLGLDVSAGENTQAAILKIPADRDEFDPDYFFQPQLQITESRASIVVNSGFLYAGSGIAYTNVLMVEPAVSTDLINEPLMAWAKLDLVNQTAELVQGIPRNAGFTAGMAYHYQNKVQLVVYNPAEGINAIYETDINSLTATQKINVTAGGIIYGFYEVDE